MILKNTLIVKDKDSKIKEIFNNPKITKLFEVLNALIIYFKIILIKILRNKFRSYSIRKNHIIYLLLNNNINSQMIMLQLRSF